MNGGASQIDLFDYKPELLKRHGQKFEPGEGVRVEAATSVPGALLRPVFDFQRQGQCGRWVSSVLPCIGRHVDDMAFLMAMTSRTNVHGPASYLMNTGFLLPGFPCMGAWISYALGNLTDNLPTFVVLPDPRGLPYNQKGNFSSGFLPVTHQGTIVGASAVEPITHLRAPEAAKFITPSADADGLSVLRHINEAHLAANPAALGRWQEATGVRIARIDIVGRTQGVVAVDPFPALREAAPALLAHIGPRVARLLA